MMPRPKGWTRKQTALRDRLAKKLEAEHADVKEPYAVATARVQAMRGSRKKVTKEAG